MDSFDKLVAIVIVSAVFALTAYSIVDRIYPVQIEAEVENEDNKQD